MSDNMPVSHITVNSASEKYAQPDIVARDVSGNCAGMNKIARIRKKRGLTQVELAAAAGCNQATISKLERGDKNATLDLIEKIARVLKVETWELFAIDDLRQRYLDALGRASEEKRRAVLLLLEGDS